MGRITENGFLDVGYDEMYQYHEPTLQKKFCLLFEGNVCAALLMDVIEDRYFTTKRFNPGGEYKRRGRYWFRSSIEKFARYYLSGMFNADRVYDEVNDLLAYGYVLYDPDEDDLFSGNHWWSLDADRLNAAFDRVGWSKKYRKRGSRDGGGSSNSDEDNEPTPGLVYALSNPSVEGYKVGYTTQKIEARMGQLNRTPAIPTEFECEHKAHCTNPVKAEGLAHSRLSDARISESSEFFDCSMGRIKRSIDQAVQAIDGDQCSD